MVNTRSGNEKEIYNYHDTNYDNANNVLVGMVHFKKSS